MLMILAEIYVLICLLFLAGKDASSYLLKDKNRSKNSLDDKRIQRWHRDGVALNALIIVPIVYLRPELYWIIFYTILLRLAVFDIAFNKWAGLNYKHLGSTAWADKFFSKIFGERGAIKKSLFFLLVLIVLNVIKH
jgi:hypothetical protein